MESLNINEGSICAPCKLLQGAKRYTEPHKNLQLLESRSVNSQFGSVNEHYYKCRSCGKSWLYESGNYGEGWVE